MRKRRRSDYRDPEVVTVPSVEKRLAEIDSVNRTAVDKLSLRDMLFWGLREMGMPLRYRV